MDVETELKCSLDGNLRSGGLGQSLIEKTPTQMCIVLPLVARCGTQEHHHMHSHMQSDRP